MNRPLKALALATFALAGALGATAVQASAANFNVNFAIKNADPSASMIRTGSLPSTITGLPNPPGAVGPGGLDPASGHAVYSDVLPLHAGDSTQVQVTYANAFDGISNPCTFTLKVAKDTNAQPYLLHMTANGGSCTAPADVRTSNGQFTSQVYSPAWAI
jgi:hypothetical protein